MAFVPSLVTPPSMEGCSYESVLTDIRYIDQEITIQNHYYIFTRITRTVMPDDKLLELKEEL